MTGPSTMPVSGPLGEFFEGFRAELADLGYSPRGSDAQLRLMGHLSRWLGVQGISAGDLTDQVSAQFVAARRGCTLRTVPIDAAGLGAQWPCFKVI